jgi:signal-transduction protein with cAMP-binding, CBS, and nucleotidyltransferase domain
MAERDVSGLPVVEDDMTLVGVLSEKDVLSLLYEQHEEEQEKTVSDFMTQPALYFDENENLLDICDFLKKNVFRRVPITSEGKLVGIISIRDVIAFILRLRGKVPRAASAGTFHTRTPCLLAVHTAAASYVHPRTFTRHREPDRAI